MPSSSPSSRIAAISLLSAALIVFARTAYPTITWWDSSSYTLAATTLGIESAPGSLILTLLGWCVTKLAFGHSIAHVLNLFASLLGATTVVIVYLVALRLTRLGDAEERPRGKSALVVGTALGALTFAFTDTLWSYAIKFTPYILTAVFTATILSMMVRWWEDADEPDAWKHLAILGLLFGLDFSVHRTNALLLPGALAWILIRRPRTLADPRSLLAGGAALLVGLAVQLLVIPIAAFGHSALNFNDPSNWSRFWDYITLKQLGGGFLLAVYPRKSSLLSVQTADVLRVLASNFLRWHDFGGILGLVPALAAATGLVALWRSNARLAMAFASVVLLQFVATIVYFNIPDDYFRSFDRHYLPICVTIAVLAAYGTAVSLAWATAARARRVLVPAVALVSCAAPATQLLTNWHSHDASNRTFARDWAVNALTSLPTNAVYFTAGDNDTFPVLYLQAVEGIRRDVTVINLWVADAQGWAARMRRRDAGFPLDQRTSPTDLALSASRPRPVTFAITTGTSGKPWPRDSARLDGLHWIVAAAAERQSNADTIRNVLFKTSKLRGFADPSVVIDADTRVMAFPYYEAGKRLLEADRAAGANEQCRSDLKTLFTLLPPDRMAMPDDYRRQLESACAL